MNWQTPQRLASLGPLADNRPVTTSAPLDRKIRVSCSEKNSLLLEINSLNHPSSAVRSNTIVSTFDDDDVSDVSSIGSSIDDDDDEIFLFTPQSGAGSSPIGVLKPLFIGGNGFSLTPKKMTAAELPSISHISPRLEPLNQMLSPRARKSKRKR